MDSKIILWNNEDWKRKEEGEEEYHVHMIIIIIWGGVNNESHEIVSGGTNKLKMNTFSSW